MANNESLDSLNYLLDNIGRIVTVYTSSGGCSGKGYRGLLVEANSCYIKLIGSLPSTPRCPFSNNNNSGCFGFNNNGGFNRRCSIVIPVSKITCFAFSERQ